MIDQIKAGDTVYLRRYDSFSGRFVMDTPLTVKALNAYGEAWVSGMARPVSLSILIKRPNNEVVSNER